MSKKKIIPIAKKGTKRKSSEKKLSTDEQAVADAAAGVIKEVSSPNFRLAHAISETNEHIYHFRKETWRLFSAMFFCMLCVGFICFKTNNLTWRVLCNVEEEKRKEDDA